jgi:DNA-binding XRE family transcriptional regulator
MTNEEKSILMSQMAQNLPILRAKLSLTQVDLAERIGVSRHTLIAIENKQRQMSWPTFLSLMLFFSKNSGTNQLLGVLGIVTEELNEYLEVERYGIQKTR